MKIPRRSKTPKWFLFYPLPKYVSLGGTAKEVDTLLLNLNLPLSTCVCAVLSSFHRVGLLWPCGLWPTRLFCPWGSPGKNTGVGCHALLQGIFPTQGLIEPTSLMSSALAGMFFTTSTTWEALAPSVHTSSQISVRVLIKEEIVSFLPRLLSMQQALTVPHGIREMQFWEEEVLIFIGLDQLRLCFVFPF